jgi:hypothetical protein
MLLTPQPIQFSLPFPFVAPEPPSAPPVFQSRNTPSKGRTRSVAMYTCVSVSSESMYLRLHARQLDQGSSVAAHAHVGMPDSAELLERVTS